MSLVGRTAAFASFYASVRAISRTPHLAQRSVSANYGKDTEWTYKHNVIGPKSGTKAFKDYEQREKGKGLFDRGLPRNQSIPYDEVQVVDPETGKLGEPESLHNLLASVDRKEIVVQLVSKEPPIVRLLNREEAVQKAKETRERERTTAIKKRRTVQFSWGVNSGDYDHKINKALEALQDRSPVDVVVTYRRGQVVDNSARDTLIRTTVQRLAEFAVYRKTSHTPGRTVLEFDLNPLALKK